MFSVYDSEGKVSSDLVWSGGEARHIMRYRGGERRKILVQIGAH